MISFNNKAFNGYLLVETITLQWRHNERDCVSNHRRLYCLLNCWFRRRSKKTSKLRVIGLCVGNSPGASNAVNLMTPPSRIFQSVSVYTWPECPHLSRCWTQQGRDLLKNRWLNIWKMFTPITMRKTRRDLAKFCGVLKGIELGNTAFIIYEPTSSSLFLCSFNPRHDISATICVFYDGVSVMSRCHL